MPPRDYRIAGLLFWLASLPVPLLFVAAEPVPGWRAFPLALKDALSIALRPADPYVLACLAATLANALFFAALALGPRPRRRRSPHAFALALASLTLAAGSLVALAFAGLQGRPHAGAALWLAAPALLAWAARPAAK